MANIDEPALPWENLEDLKSVYNNLLVQARLLQNDIKNQYRNQALHDFELSKVEMSSINDYNQEITKLRGIIKTLNNDLAILKMNVI